MLNLRHNREPECTSCNRRMTFAAEVARLGERPGMRYFTCEQCGGIASVTVSLPAILEMGVTPRLSR